MAWLSLSDCWRSDGQQGVHRRAAILLATGAWAGVLEGAGPLLHQGKVVERIQDILFAVIGAGVGGNDLVVGQNFDVEGVGTQGELFAGFVGGDGIAIGLEGDLPIAVERHFSACAAGEGGVGKGRR